MTTLLCIIAILILSIGIIFPRVKVQKLSPDELKDLESIRAGLRRYYFLSLTPLFIMAILVYMEKLSGSLYQIPAASLIIDFFCLFKLRQIQSGFQNARRLRFTYIPFVSLALTKLLLFAAFLIELNDQLQRQSEFSFR